MNDRLLLLAEQGVFEALMSDSGLRADLFAMREPSLSPTDRSLAGRIVHVNPEELLVRNRSDVDATHRREVLYAQMLTQPIVHLVVLGRDEASSTAVRAVQEVAEWYAAFRLAVGGVFHERRHNYPYSVVAIACDALRREDVQTLQTAVLGPATPAEGADSEPPERRGGSRRLFLMMHRLEVAAADLFHARYVWPVAVGRLLVYLREHGDARGENGLFAWRSFAVQPGVDEEALDAECRAALVAAHRLLLANAHEPAGGRAPERFDGGAIVASSKGLPSREIAVPGRFIEFDVVAETARTAAPDRFESVIREHGQALRTDLFEQAIGRIKAIRHQLGATFGGVAQSPGRLEAALSQERPRQTDVGGELKARLSVWTQMRRLETTEAERLVEVAAVGPVLQAAQRSFLSLPVRFGIAGVVALATTYVTFFLTKALIPGWEPAVLSAVLALFGATAAVVLSHVTEKRRGERAVGGFVQRLKRVDDAADARHQLAQQSRIDAASIGSRLRARAAARRLIELCERAQTFVVRELQPSARVGTGAGALPGHASFAADRRLAYVAATTVGSSRKVPLGRVRDEVIEALNQKHIGRLLVRWRELCDTWDADRNGNLPARVFVPELRHRYRELAKAVDECVRTGAHASMRAEDRQALAAELRMTVEGPFAHNLSCHLADALEERQGTRAYLFRNPTYTVVGQDGEPDDPLTRMALAHAVDAPSLTGQPTVAVLVELVAITAEPGSTAVSDGPMRTRVHFDA